MPRFLSNGRRRTFKTSTEVLTFLVCTESKRGISILLLREKHTSDRRMEFGDGSSCPLVGGGGGEEETRCIGYSGRKSSFWFLVSEGFSLSSLWEQIKGQFMVAGLYDRSVHMRTDQQTRSKTRASDNLQKPIPSDLLLLPRLRLPGEPQLSKNSTTRREQSIQA